MSLIPRLHCIGKQYVEDGFLLETVSSIGKQHVAGGFFSERIGDIGKPHVAETISSSNSPIAIIILLSLPYSFIRCREGSKFAHLKPVHHAGLKQCQ